MPLTDEQVSSTLDWLGRTQPVGQKQLALSTATGGAPAGGPVTPGGGVVESAEPGGGAPGGPGGKTGGGASPIMQAVRVADLVRRAAGLIPAGAAEVPGAFGGERAFGSQIAQEGGAQGLRTLGTTTGGLEGGLSTSVSAPGGEQAAALGAQGLGDVGDVAAAGAGGVAQALPYVGAALGIGQTIAGNDPDVVKALDSLSYATAPFTFGITALIPTIMHALGLQKWFGPSRAWLQFPEHLGQTLGLEGSAMKTLESRVNAAQSPADLQAAVDELKTTVGTKVGGFGSPEWNAQYLGVNPALAGGLPADSPYMVPYLPGATGTEHEGGQVAELSDFVAAANQAIKARLDAFNAPTPGTAPTPSAADAQTPASMPSMDVGGPEGALGFSRDVLQAA